MKKGLLVLTALVFSVACVFSMVGAADAPENIEMKSPVFKKHKKAIVTLSHKKHAEDYKIACADCHHHYEGDKNVWKEGDKVQKCDECHVTPKKNKGKTLSMYNAFHKNCRDCHKDEKKKNKKTKAPTKCAQCHDKDKDK